MLSDEMVSARHLTSGGGLAKTQGRRSIGGAHKETALPPDRTAESPGPFLHQTVTLRTHGNRFDLFYEHIGLAQVINYGAGYDKFKNMYT
jgi:hypothetical protein